MTDQPDQSVGAFTWERFVFDGIMQLFNGFRDLLYQVLKIYQSFTEPLLGEQSYWFAIVLLTITIRVVLLPLTVKQIRSMRAMSEVAPELKKLQVKYKDDKEKLGQETMKLYRERGVNPAASCLPMLAQMPIFIALYQVVFTAEIAGERNILLEHSFLGVSLDTRWWRLDGFEKLLSVEAVVILALVGVMVAATHYSQQQTMARQAEVNPQMQSVMRFMPLMFGLFAVNIPLAVIIYWVTTSVWTLGQQWFMLRNQPIPEGSAAARKRAATEQVRQQRARGGSEPAGMMAQLRSRLRPGTTATGTTAPSRNGKHPVGPEATDGTASTSTSTGAESSPSRKTKTRSGGSRPKSGAEGRRKSTGSKSGGATSSGKSRSGSASGSSSSHAGGGKGSARAQQRRRKR